MPKFYRNWDEHAEPYSLRGSEKPQCIFFAEGLSEAMFLEQWLTTVGTNPDEVAVINYRGGSKLSILVRRLSEDENFLGLDRFGFFLDAEGGTAASKASMVTAALAKVKVIPAGHNIHAGVLSNVNGKRVALFVSPNNLGAGFIEDIAINEVAAHQLAGCMNAFRQCIQGVLGTSVGSKALIQAFLGVNKPGLCGTGRGFEKGILQVMHAAYADVRTTLSGVL